MISSEAEHPRHTFSVINCSESKIDGARINKAYRARKNIRQPKRFNRELIWLSQLEEFAVFPVCLCSKKARLSYIRLIVFGKRYSFHHSAVNAKVKLIKGLKIIRVGGRKGTRFNKSCNRIKQHKVYPIFHCFFRIRLHHRFRRALGTSIFLNNPGDGPALAVGASRARHKIRKTHSRSLASPWARVGALFFDFGLAFAYCVRGGIRLAHGYHCGWRQGF